MESSRAPRAVATIGVFDGVHRGHEVLIGRVITEARRTGSLAVVFTFEPHPARILAPDREPCLLTPGEEKIILLRRLGADQVRIIHFDRPMSNLSPEEFVDRHLRLEVRLSHLVIGHDFALGKDRAGDHARLETIGASRGFSVSRVEAVLSGNEVISSTVIRRAVARGDLAAARRWLGRSYTALGPVVPGSARGRTLGFPTANLSLPPRKQMPPQGVYAGWARLADEPAGPEHPAVMNYGTRPTFEGGDPLLEVHLIGFSGDLAGRLLEAGFEAWIRGEMRFPDPRALAARIREDVAAAKSLLARKGSPGSPD